jgi:hypothetical protein
MTYDPRGHVSPSALMMRATSRPISGVTAPPATLQAYDDDEEDLARYVDMFEEAEQATDTERTLSERDRDYYDNKQLTEAEKAILAKRGQPAIVINRVKRKVDFLRGVEQQQRTDPKAFPRNPQDEDSAHAATDALRYVADQNRYDVIRSAAWENLLIEGLCGAEVVVEQKRDEMEIVVRHLPWDRLFRDPHSREADCSDGNYLGLVMWMDVRDARLKWPDAADDLDSIVAGNNNSLGDTFDDRPNDLMWCDSKRKRVRVVQIWIKRQGGWHWCTFTRGIKLEGGDSPYHDEDGDPECPMILSSAYIARDNARYGVVREMIGPQDEINKRRSKALHLLTMRQVVADKGAVDDTRIARQELAKPDGYLEVAPNKRFEIQQTADLAAGQFQLLQHATQEIDNLGPNASMEGKSPASQSGRAIQAQQQGGYIELGPMMDRLRQFNVQIYRAIWSRIRQFWREEKWIRVTDDERNIKFVPLNKPIKAGDQYAEQLKQMGLPPEQIQMELQAMQGDPRLEQVVGVQNNVAEMDVDIIVDDAPDSITIQHEQYELLVQLVQSGIQLPPDVIIEASQLRNKEQLLEKLRNPQGTDPQAAQAAAQQQQQAQALIMAKSAAEVKLLEAQAMKATADAQATMIEVQKPTADEGPDQVTPLDEQEQMATIEGTHAKAELARAQTQKTLAEAHMVANPVPETPKPQPQQDPNQGHQGELMRAQTLKTLAEAHAVANPPPPPKPAKGKA